VTEELAVVGYYVKWQPTSPASKRYCPWGHDKAAVGVTIRRHCAECARQVRTRSKTKRIKRNPESSIYAAHIENLTVVRERLGLSRSELARRAGIKSDATIGKLERKEIRAKPQTYQKIIRALEEAMR